MDKDEILVSLVPYIKNLATENKGEFIVIYENVDKELAFPIGSTKNLLPELIENPELLDKIEIEIVKEWETRIKLKRKLKKHSPIWLN